LRYSTIAWTSAEGTEGVPGSNDPGASFGSGVAQSWGTGNEDGALLLQFVGSGEDKQQEPELSGAALLQQLQSGSEPLWHSQGMPPSRGAARAGVIGEALPGKGKSSRGSAGQVLVMRPRTPGQATRWAGSPVGSSPEGDQVGAGTLARRVLPMVAPASLASPGGKAAGKGESRSKIRASAAAARARPESLKLAEACSLWSASTTACTEGGTDVEEQSGGGNTAATTGAAGSSGAAAAARPQRRRGAQRRGGGEKSAAAAMGTTAAGAEEEEPHGNGETAASAQPRAGRRSGARRGSRARSGSHATNKYQ